MAYYGRFLLALVVALSMRGRAGAQTVDPASPLSEDQEGLGADDEPVGPSSRIACLNDVDDDGFARKGVQRRDFLKRLRAEISGLGGLLASDVLSSTYTFGGAASFFPVEDFGLELMVTRAPVQFRLEQAFTGFDLSERFKPGTAWQAMGAVLMSPFHAKFKVTDATIVHGDLFLLAGGGRTFDDTVQGLSWQAGVGMKLYLARYLSFRFDLRDIIVPQEVLGRGRIAHNVAVLAGLGVWTP